MSTVHPQEPSRPTSYDQPTTSPFVPFSSPNPQRQSTSSLSLLTPALHKPATAIAPLTWPVSTQIATTHSVATPPPSIPSYQHLHNKDNPNSTIGMPKDMFLQKDAFCV